MTHTSMDSETTANLSRVYCPSNKHIPMSEVSTEYRTLKIGSCDDNEKAVNWNKLGTNFAYGEAAVLVESEDGSQIRRI